MRKILITFLTAALACTADLSTAQELPRLYLGVETGAIFLGGKMASTDYLRSDMPSYPSGTPGATHVSSLMFRNFIGIKPEYFVAGGKLGLSTGLLYTWFFSSAGRKSYWSDGTDFFYVLTREKGINTEYLKVKEFRQNTGYIGIPLEIRYFPYRPHFANAYFKLGAELDFRAATHTEAVFCDEAMKPFQQEVADVIGRPASFSSMAYAAAGVKLGRPGRPSVSLELCVPAVVMTRENTGLANPKGGAGLRLFIQFPLKSYEE